MKNEVTKFRLCSLIDPHFISTSLAKYEQNGIAKDWEIVHLHDFIDIVINP